MDGVTYKFEDIKKGLKREKKPTPPADAGDVDMEDADDTPNAAGGSANGARSASGSRAETPNGQEGTAAKPRAAVVQQAKPFVPKKRPPPTGPFMPKKPPRR